MFTSLVLVPLMLVLALGILTLCVAGYRAGSLAVHAALMGWRVGLVTLAEGIAYRWRWSYPRAVALTVGLLAVLAYGKLPALVALPARPIGATVHATLALADGLLTPPSPTFAPRRPRHAYRDARGRFARVPADIAWFQWHVSA